VLEHAERKAVMRAPCHKDRRKHSVAIRHLQLGGLRLGNLRLGHLHFVQNHSVTR
jgi:hypothetical protein